MIKKYAFRAGVILLLSFLPSSLIITLVTILQSGYSENWWRAFDIFWIWSTSISRLYEMISVMQFVYYAIIASVLLLVVKWFMQPSWLLFFLLNIGFAMLGTMGPYIMAFVLTAPITAFVLSLFLGYLILLNYLSPKRKA